MLAEMETVSFVALFLLLFFLTFVKSATEEYMRMIILIQLKV